MPQRTHTCYETERRGGEKTTKFEKTTKNLLHIDLRMEKECIQKCLSVVNLDFVALEKTKPTGQNVH